MKIPKTGNILIPKIEKKIELIQKKFFLKPEIPVSKFLRLHKNKKHRYFSPCFTPEGKKVAFFARLHNNLDAKEKFKNEIKFLSEIKRKEFKIKKLIPEIIDFCIEEDFEWLTREYPKENPLGHSRNILRNIKKETIEKIGKITFEISKVPYQKFSFKLKKFNPKNYLRKEIYQFLIEKKLIEKKVVKNILNKIENEMDLIKSENRYFSHGDLNLGNILSNKNIWIIDWELVKLNNLAYDIGYLWAHLWEAKKNLRESLIRTYLKNLKNDQLKKFKRLFPIVVSYLSLGGILTKKREEDFRKRRRFYQKLLRNCQDFEKLILI